MGAQSLLSATASEGGLAFFADSNLQGYFRGPGCLVRKVYNATLQVDALNLHQRL
jgi:hypothetical protein